MSKRLSNVSLGFHIAFLMNNDIVIKLEGDIVSRLDCRMAKFSFNLINHNNPIVQNITKFKLVCP